MLNFFNWLHWFGLAGFWIISQLLFFEKGWMGVSQRLTNMVSVWGSKEVMLGYVTECNFQFENVTCLIWFTWLFVFQSKEEKYFINNHLSFRVMYHKDPETDSARIVGFEVTPNRYCRLAWFCVLFVVRWLLYCCFTFFFFPIISFNFGEQYQSRI